MAGYYYSDPVNTSETHGVSYTYGGVSRLLTAATNTSTAWGYQYTYDAYGNLSVMQPTQGTPPSMNVTVSGANNQVTTSPYAYDASGDMTNDNSQTFTYDAEGRISTMGGSALGFNYNAFGEYVSFTENGTVAGAVPYDLDGHNLGLYTAADDNWTDYYVYMGGRQIAWMAQVNEYFTHFIHTNNTGSTAQVTDQSGNLVYDMIYYPFGMMWTGSGSWGDTLFGGMEPYNWGMGLNEALKRWQVPPLGRWLTPDPAGKGAVHLDDPQTWNAYAYVRNNPTTLTDPSGLLTPAGGIDPFESTHVYTGTIESLDQAEERPAGEKAQQQNNNSTPAPAAQHGHFEYDQKTGQMTHVLPDGTRVAVGTGYSGQGNGLNNPSEQYTPNTGPIPQGTYTIEPQRDNVTGAGHKLPGSMRLDPTRDTDTHGRAGFLIHGDNSRGDHSASNGCIILPRPARNDIGGSSDHILVVVP